MGRRRGLKLSVRATSAASGWAIGTSAARSLSKSSGASISVLLDGRSYEAHAEPGADGAWITIRGRRFHVIIADPRRWTAKQRRRAGPGARKYPRTNAGQSGARARRAGRYGQSRAGRHGDRSHEDAERDESAPGEGVWPQYRCARARRWAPARFLRPLSR